MATSSEVNLISRKSHTIWQIAGGAGSRSHADIFLRYGVGLIGPGDAGAWRPDRDDSEFEGGSVRRFASEVKVGDIFLLRAGISSISAVGIVASDYQHLNQFDDVNGLGLQHARRVRWYKLPEEYVFGDYAFGAGPPCFSKIGTGEVLDYAERFINSPPTHWQTASLPILPSEEPSMGDVPGSLKGIVAAVNDLLPLFEARKTFGDPPSEDELIVHFIVPFFRALGWPSEQIAIKWRLIDIAIFKALPRIPENCQFVVEAKRLGFGVEGALEQARGYVVEVGTQPDIVVTDGVRYRMYESKNNFEPIAYANLARLKKSAANLFDKLEKPTKEKQDAGTLV